MPVLPFDPARRAALRGASALAAAVCTPALAAINEDALHDAGAPFPQPALAGTYHGQIAPSLCLVSEKYDGVRAIWDGRSLRHRSGRAVTAPPAFLAALPAVPLDGELWLGRGRFDALSAIVRKHEPRASEWAGVRFMVFDLPEAAAGRFAERAGRIAAIAGAAGAGPVHAAPQFRVADDAALRRRLAEVVSGGGEGLVLHRADALWQPGRSEDVLKLKPQLDAEAEVVAYRPGRGKYQGFVGALDVKAPDGRRFLVGSGLNDALRHDPPAPGETITYRYRDFTSSGLPRFATYLRRHEPL